MSDPAESNPTPPMSSVLISIEPPPKPKRGRAIALVAVVALLVGGFVTYLVTADGSKHQYSLTAAVQAAQTPRSSAFELTMSVGSFGGLTSTGRIDVNTQRMAMEMDMTSLGGVKLSAIIDIASQTLYVDTQSLGDSAPDAPTRWISMDASEMGGMGGIDLTGDPGAMTSVLADQQRVTDLGLEDLKGEHVRHYRVSVPLATVMAQNPDMSAQMDELGVTLPDSIDYDVFVTKGNELRSMAFSLDMMGQSLEVTMTFTKYDDIDPIELPDPADVTEQTLSGV